jgi:hypothetical protein
LEQKGNVCVEDSAWRDMHAAATKKKYFTPLDSNERNFDPENWVCLMRMRPDNGSGHGEEIEQ